MFSDPEGFSAFRFPLYAVRVFVKTGSGCLSIVRSYRLALGLAGGRVGKTLAAVVTFDPG